jgi:hypothetical protein
MQQKLITTKCRIVSGMKSKILLITVFYLLGVTAFADIYRWIDEDGKVHYSDKPAQNVETERMKMEPSNVPKRPNEGQLRLRLREQAEKEAALRIEARRARSGAERAEREEHLAQERRCLEARKQLAVLQEQLPVYRDEKGKFRAKWLRDTYQGRREYLDDATRASEIGRVQQTITSYCQNRDDAEEQELARKQWIRSEHCFAARADLEALERPGARAPRQTLEEKRQVVERYCKE